MSVSLGPRAVLRGPLGSTGAAHQARGSAPSALRQRWAAPPSAKWSPSCRALDRGPSTVLPSHRGLFSPRDGAPAPKVKQAPPASFSPGSETPPFSSASRRLLNRPLADCSPFPPSRVSSAGQRSPAAPHGLLTNLQRLGRFGAVLAPSARLVSRPPNPRSDHAHSRLLRLVQPAPPPDYNRHNALRPARDWLSPAAAPNGTLCCWQVAPSGRAGAPEPPPAMGSAESSEGRRASFGMDEEERVRVLQGIRLSESVVTRMKNSSQPARTGPTAPPPAALGSSRGLDTDCKVSRPECGRGWQPSGAEVGPLRRCEEELATGQGQLPHVAVREGEAALRREEISVDQEKQRSARMARELESREAELRRRDAFYKEQLGGLERKNMETYRLSSQQFHEAASKVEGTIKPRRLEPVCSGLQDQILRCYRDHLQEVLLCSDLVKAYQHCVSAAHKG